MPPKGTKRTAAKQPAKEINKEPKGPDGGKGAASASSVVDFTKLNMSTLERYKRHYRLKTRQNVTKAELAKAIVKHFSTQTVNESDTINLFVYNLQ
mmetsp:Transcript_57402/g.157638  ORF Transcript_57402/g.157638 Transcript_57402/m.157638 type:complete len:96 (+) Transcript_57402:37-324(+)